MTNSVRTRFLDGPKVIEELRAIARRLVETEPRVDLVVLFGALARGDYRADTDAEVCVILRHEDHRQPRERIREFISFFRRASVPVDLMVYTQAEFAQMRQSGSRLADEIVRQGVTLATTSLPSYE